MFIYKRGYSILFKAIALAIVCLFVFNDISWALLRDHSPASGSTLAPQIQINDPIFQEKFLVGESILAQKGIRHYIDKQLADEKLIFGEKWESHRKRVISLKHASLRGRIKYSKSNPVDSIVFIKLSGLFVSTGGLPAVVDLSSKEFGGIPVVYMDSMYCNTADECVGRHEIDEILQWEDLRENILCIDKRDMRKWIKWHIDTSDKRLKGTPFEGMNSRQIAKAIHGYSYPLRDFYKTIKVSGDTDFDYEYIRTMLSMYGADEKSDEEIVIAAHNERSPKKVQRSAPPAAALDFKAIAEEALDERSLGPGRWKPIMYNKGKGNAVYVYTAENGKEYAVFTNRLKEGKKPEEDDRELYYYFLAQRELFNRINPGGARKDLPNLVWSYEDASEGKAVLIFDAFKEGRTLYETSLKDWPYEKRLETALSIANTMQYLHGKNVRHRDLCPLNIWIPDSGPPIVMDFDLSIMLDETGQKGYGPYAELENAIFYHQGFSYVTKPDFTVREPKWGAAKSKEDILWKASLDPRRLDACKDLFGFGTVLAHLFECGTKDILSQYFTDHAEKNISAWQDELSSVINSSRAPDPIKKILLKLMNLRPEETKEAKYAWQDIIECLRGEIARSDVEARRKSGAEPVSILHKDSTYSRMAFSEFEFNAPGLIGIVPMVADNAIMRDKNHFIVWRKALESGGLPLSSNIRKEDAPAHPVYDLYRLLRFKSYKDKFLSLEEISRILGSLYKDTVSDSLDILDYLGFIEKSMGGEAYALTRRIQNMNVVHRQILEPILLSLGRHPGEKEKFMARFRVKRVLARPVSDAERFMRKPLMPEKKFADEEALLEVVFNAFISKDPGKRQELAILFLGWLVNDFKFPPGVAKKIDSFKDGKNFEIFLRDDIQLDNVPLKRMENVPVVYLEKYIIALAAIFHEAGSEGAPAAKPFIRNIVNGAIDESCMDKLNLTSPYESYHIWNDSAVAYWEKKEYLYKPKGSRYEPRPWETKPVESKDEAALNKIKKALNIAARRLKAMEKEANGDMPLVVKDTLTSKDFRALRKTTTIIQIADSPLPVIFTDPVNNVVRPASNGRSRRVIYIPKLFLADFNINSPMDMDELASHLIYMFEWNNIHKQLARKRRSPEEIYDRLNKLTMEFTQKNRYRLTLPSLGRRRLFNLMKKSLVLQCTKLAPMLLDKYDAVTTQAIELLKANPDGYDCSDAVKDLTRLSFRQVERGLATIILYFDLLGNRDIARYFFDDREKYIRIIQSSELGMLPCSLQREIVLFYLRHGDTEKFLENLKIFLTGKHFPKLSKLYETKHPHENAQSDHRAQVDYMLEEARYYMPGLEAEINYVLESLKRTEGDPVRRDAIGETLDEARRLIDNFKHKGHRRSPLAEVAPSPITKDKDKALKAFAAGFVEKYASIKKTLADLVGDDSIKKIVIWDRVGSAPGEEVRTLPLLIKSLLETYKDITDIEVVTPYPAVVDSMDEDKVRGILPADFNPAEYEDKNMPDLLINFTMPKERPDIKSRHAIDDFGELFKYALVDIYKKFRRLTYEEVQFTYPEAVGAILKELGLIVPLESELYNPAWDKTEKVFVNPHSTSNSRYFEKLRRSWVDLIVSLIKDKKRRVVLSSGDPRISLDARRTEWIRNTVMQRLGMSEAILSGHLEIFSGDTNALFKSVLASEKVITIDSLVNQMARLAGVKYVVIITDKSKIWISRNQAKKSAIDCEEFREMPESVLGKLFPAEPAAPSGALQLTNRDHGKLKEDADNITFSQILESPDYKKYIKDRLDPLEDVLKEHHINPERSYGAVLRDTRIPPYVKWRIHEILIDDVIRSFYEEGAERAGLYHHNYGESKNKKEKNKEEKELGLIEEFFKGVLGETELFGLLEELRLTKRINVLVTERNIPTLFYAHASPTFGINICDSCEDKGAAIVHELMAFWGSADDSFNERVEAAYVRWRGAPHTNEDIEAIKREIDVIRSRPRARILSIEDLPHVITHIEKSQYIKDDAAADPFGSIEEMASLKSVIDNIDILHTRQGRLNPVFNILPDESHGKILQGSLKEEMKILSGLPRLIATLGKGKKDLRDEAKACIIKIIKHCPGILLDEILLEFHRQQVQLTASIRRAFEKAYFEEMSVAGEDEVPISPRQMELRNIFKFISILARRALYFDRKHMKDLAENTYRMAYGLLQRYLKKAAVTERDELRDGKPALETFFLSPSNNQDHIGSMVRKFCDASVSQRLQKIGIDLSALDIAYRDLCKYSGDLETARTTMERFKIKLKIKLSYSNQSSDLSDEQLYPVNEEDEGGPAVIKAIRLAGFKDEWDELRADLSKTKKRLEEARATFIKEALLASTDERDWASLSPHSAVSPGALRSAVNIVVLNEPPISDIDNALEALDKLIPSIVKDTGARYYRISYNDEKIPPGSKCRELLELYANVLLPMKLGRDRIRNAIGSGERKKGIVWVECYKDRELKDKAGECHVDIEEDISGKVMRLIGMLNMAIIGSNIPQNMTDKERERYEPLMALLAKQYKEMTQAEFSWPEALKNIKEKGIWIDLPRAVRIPVNISVGEYYETTIKQLNENA